MVDWSLGVQRQNPINALMQGMEHGNALRQQGEDRRLQQEDRDFNRQRVLKQDERQAVVDTRQDAAFGQQQKQWSQQDQDRIREDLLREAYSIRTMPGEQRIAHFRQSVIPKLRELGIPPEQLEPHLNDEAFSDDEVDSFIAQMGGEIPEPAKMQLVQQQGYVGSFDPRSGSLTGLREPPADPMDDLRRQLMEAQIAAQRSLGGQRERSNRPKPSGGSPAPGASGPWSKYGG